MKKEQEEVQDLTLAEFAKAARVTYHTARDWAIKGIIPSYRIGRVIRIPAGTFEKIRAEGIRRSERATVKLKKRPDSPFDNPPQLDPETMDQIMAEAASLERGDV